MCKVFEVFIYTVFAILIGFIILGGVAPEMIFRNHEKINSFEQQVSMHVIKSPTTGQCYEVVSRVMGRRPTQYLPVSSSVVPCTNGVLAAVMVPQ